VQGGGRMAGAERLLEQIHAPIVRGALK